jgi:hypothetical protein
MLNMMNAPAVPRFGFRPPSRTPSPPEQAALPHPDGGQQLAPVKTLQHIDVATSFVVTEEIAQYVAVLRKGASGARTAFPILREGEPLHDDLDGGRFRLLGGQTLRVVPLSAVVQLPNTPWRSLDSKRVANILRGLVDQHRFLPIDLHDDMTLANGFHRMAVARLLGYQQITVRTVG